MHPPAALGLSEPAARRRTREAAPARVSERTVARRISRLPETLGSQARFQLGVQASRQGSI